MRFNGIENRHNLLENRLDLLKFVLGLLCLLGMFEVHDALDEVVQVFVHLFELLHLLQLPELLKSCGVQPFAEIAIPVRDYLLPA